MFLLIKLTGGAPFHQRYPYVPVHSSALIDLNRWTYRVVAASEYADAIRAAYRLLAKEGR